MSTSATSSKLARTAAAGALVDELGDWSSGSGAVYRLLTRAIAHAIDRGALLPGARLPSERELAIAVTVSRGTAVAAYDLLVADGRIERRRGSGTFVAGAEVASFPEGREGTTLVHRLVDASADRADPRAVIDLSLSVLPDTAALGAVSLTRADLDAIEPATGYSPWGLPGLRDALAGHVSAWGLPTTAEQIVVTTGAQQAISVAATCWIRPGDTVVLDDPTYPGAIAAFQQAGARLVGVPVDDQGIDPDALEAAVRARPALVYLQPAVHSPTGITTTAVRRARLAEILTDARVPLVEDRSLVDLSWAHLPPPLSSLMPDGPTMVIGSLGKRFWGGLRLGYLRAPTPLALRATRIKATHDLGTSALSQVVGERLLRGSTEADRRRQADWAETSYRALGDAVRAALPAWSWPEPTGGLSMWVDLGGLDAEAFTRAAPAFGVTVAGPTALSVRRDAATHIRLCFAVTPDSADRAVAALRATAAAAAIGARCS